MAFTVRGGYDSREADKFVIRLPPGERDRVKVTAERNKRSMNNECLLALEWWLDKQHLMDLLEKELTAELGRLRRLKPVMNHSQALKAIARDYPDMAALVSVIQSRIDNVV